MPSNFKSVRIQIQQSKQPQVADEWWLSPSFTDHVLGDYLNYNDTGKQLLKVNINKDNNRSGDVSNSAFHLSASQPLDAQYQQTEEFLTTENQELYLMEKYQHISFEIKSKRFLGWGERATD